MTVYDAIWIDGSSIHELCMLVILDSETMILSVAGKFYFGVLIDY